MSAVERTLRVTIELPLGVVEDDAELLRDCYQLVRLVCAGGLADPAFRLQRGALTPIGSVVEAQLFHRAAHTRESWSAIRRLPPEVDVLASNPNGAS